MAKKKPTIICYQFIIRNIDSVRLSVDIFIQLQYLTILLWWPYRKFCVYNTQPSCYIHWTIYKKLLCFLQWPTSHKVLVNYIMSVVLGFIGRDFMTGVFTLLVTSRLYRALQCLMYQPFIQENSLFKICNCWPHSVWCTSHSYRRILCSRYVTVGPTVFDVPAIHTGEFSVQDM